MTEVRHAELVDLYESFLRSEVGFVVIDIDELFAMAKKGVLTLLVCNYLVLIEAWAGRQNFHSD
jgi:hypothetical protein